MVMIRAERPDDEAIRLDADGGELRARSGLDVARQQSEHDVVASLELVEQRADPGEDVIAMIGAVELRVEQRVVAIQDQIQPRVDVRVAHPCAVQQLAHDLGIGLAVEGMVARVDRAEMLLERPEDRPPDRGDVLLLASVLIPIAFHDWATTWAICAETESPAMYQNSILNCLTGPPRSVFGSMLPSGVGVAPSHTPSPFWVRPASVRSCFAISWS